MTSDKGDLSEVISYTPHAAPLGCCIRGTFPKCCICRFAGVLSRVVWRSVRHVQTEAERELNDRQAQL